MLLNFGQTLRSMFAWAGDFVAGSVEYVLLGAIIVVPVWLIVFFAGKLARQINAALLPAYSPAIRFASPVKDGATDFATLSSSASKS